MDLLSESLSKTLKNSELQGITTNLGEVALDSCLNNGVLKDIPIIGSIIGTAKTVATIRDQLFLKKIIKFLSQTVNVSQMKREIMISKIEANDEFKVKIGEKLLFIIDRCDDYEKAIYLSKLFNGFLKEDISYDQFLRTSAIIEPLYIGDLKSFINNNWLQLNVDDAQYILNSGLVNLQNPVVAVEGIDAQDEYVVTGSELTVYISELGQIIREILK